MKPPRTLSLPPLARVAALAGALVASSLAACGPSLREQAQYSYGELYTVQAVAVAPQVVYEQPQAVVLRFELPDAYAYTRPAQVRVHCGGAWGTFAPQWLGGVRYAVALEGAPVGSACQVQVVPQSYRVTYRHYEPYVAPEPPSGGYVLRPVRYRMDL